MSLCLEVGLTPKTVANGTLLNDNMSASIHADAINGHFFNSGIPSASFLRHNGIHASLTAEKEEPIEPVVPWGLKASLKRTNVPIGRIRRSNSTIATIRKKGNMAANIRHSQLSCSIKTDVSTARVDASFITATFAYFCPVDYIRSCFGSGGWINDAGWMNDEGWNNGKV